MFNPVKAIFTHLKNKHNDKKFMLYQTDGYNVFVPEEKIDNLYGIMIIYGNISRSGPRNLRDCYDEVYDWFKTIKGEFRGDLAFDIGYLPSFTFSRAEDAEAFKKKFLT